MPRNVILLRGDAHEEAGIADPYAITPGMLVEPTTTAGGVNAYQPHSTAGGAAAALFARNQHENNGAGIDDVIAVGDEVTVLHPTKGAKINAVTAETIERGESVESAGDGTVTVATSGAVIGVAYATSDLSGTVGRVEIIIQ